MARNFLPIHCREFRRDIPSRGHQRRREYYLLPRPRQRDVVPARQRHGAIASDGPQNYERNDRGWALSTSAALGRSLRFAHTTLHVPTRSSIRSVEFKAQKAVQYE